jgi:hypothetical protein
MSQGSPYASMKEYLPEWDDSDAEWELTQRQLSQPLDFTSTPLGPTSKRNTLTQTPKEVKVHPFPNNSNQKVSHQQPSRETPHQRVPNSTKSVKSVLRRHPNDEAHLHQHFPTNPIPAHGYAEVNPPRGNVHDNEILMYREKLLQSVESVQCINDTLDSVCQYIDTERTIDEKVYNIL